MIFTATCLFGLESFLGEEIDGLGYKRLETIDGRITFEAPVSCVAEFNLWSRFAERLFWNAGSFDCFSFDDLFEGTKALPWEEMIGKNDAFPVNGHSIKSALFSIPDCQKIVKKAIVTRLGSKYHLSVLPETGLEYKVEFFILKNRATLMIDLSGNPLHKRGYRPQSGVAPLRETLAAALVKCARPRENVMIWDPFCGSGTIVVEAAMMMKNRAPGLKRSFVSEKYPLLSAKEWSDIREKAKSCEIKDSAFKATGTDIDPACVDLAKEIVHNANLDDCITIYQMDARKIVKPEGIRGTIVTNPPYGDRMMTKTEAEKLYRDIGKAFSKLTMWQQYILTSDEKFPLYFGRRADKIRKLYNGMIPCFYYQFYKNK